MSVKAVRSDGDDVVLQLRNGGEMRMDKSLLLRVAPDEVEYPEEAAAEAPADAPEAITPVEHRISGDYRDLIASASARYGVDARIVDAVVQVESAYDSRAVSRRGARGLMQLMPSTGRQYGVLNLFDPKSNLEAGIQHLKRLLTRYELPVALAAYNAGEAAVDRFGGMPPFKETRKYVARILRIINEG